ncbi:hypothetical protein BBJ28_00020060, partial [Nothophytophthora sp. Chile5]
ITEYCGWDHTAATFTANIFSSLLVVYVVVFVQLWQVYYEGNLAQGLRTEQCSAPCPAGFFCPEGSATPAECGAADRYCPVGSTQPSLVPAGFFAIGGEPSQRRRSSVLACEPGSFCVSGTSYPCPAGSYGARTQLATRECSGSCPVGHFCPKASVLPTPCPSGAFGAAEGLTDAGCSGLCPAGYACPEGSASATTWPCDEGTFCPIGSATPRLPKPGTHVVALSSPEEAACPLGSFCSPAEAPGAARLCPAGTFGNSTGLTTAACSGVCRPGFYCPRGSTSATQVPCGGVTLYCPSGSAAPTPVDPGHYTVADPTPAASYSVEALAQRAAQALVTRVTQRRCEPGDYCVAGERYACPAGTFGGVSGLSEPTCSGPCAAGYYCPEGSLVARAVACGSSVAFCPSGSTLPIPTAEGHCAIAEEGADGARFTAQRPAESGEFAWRGTCYPCPAGMYGSEVLETRPTCSGPCAAGYYCPVGSTTATQHECGAAALYCPEGSAKPWSVTQGYYTSLDVRAIVPSTTQAPGCGPGLYRDFSSTVNAFMDVVTGRSPIAVNYGDVSFPIAPCVACPSGTFKSETGDGLELCQRCPEFTTVSTSDRRSCLCFRLAGGDSFDVSSFTLRFAMASLSCELVPRALAEAMGDDAAGNSSVYTRSQQFPCEKGYTCSAGVRSPCPAGSYGDQEMETRATCTGVCTAGFYCPLASRNSTALVCGHANVFCPSGSVVPTPVWLGYYSIRSAVDGELLPSASGFEALSVVSTGEQAAMNEAIRDAQRLCEPGSFCRGGRKFPCPAGHNGDQPGEVSPRCTGRCSRGYYCPEGSTSSRQRECGGDALICRSGSPQPVLIPLGYYSIGVTNTTRFFQRPCELGYFCMSGIKYQCPAGTYGASSGLTTPRCSGRCAAGYYCPSYPELPSVSSRQKECGNASVYCPEGSGNSPRLVPSGYFSVLTEDSVDDGRNATQSGVEICPRGFYCRQGIRIRCPEGTYGDEEGLSAAACSGWCPAGFFCPFATADYRRNACPSGKYATRGASVCMDCPASTQSREAVLETFRLLLEDQAAAPPCTTHRDCCFFG